MTPPLMRAPSMPAATGGEDECISPARTLLGRRRASVDTPGSSSQSELLSLSDLIRKGELKRQTPLYEHDEVDGRTDDAAVLKHVLQGGVVETQDAIQATEHGNSLLLAKFLQEGGDPNTVSRFHHMHWNLLQLAAGCATLGGPQAQAGSYRSRPEPDCNDGYATCVSLLLAAGADPDAASAQGGYTPLMGACLTGGAESCWLLIRAGAKLDTQAHSGMTPLDFAQKEKPRAGNGITGNTGGPGKAAETWESVHRVLDHPPRVVPRSPLKVQATILPKTVLDEEDDPHMVEVSWEMPSQSSLLPVVCGSAECVIITCWRNGQATDVVKASSSTSHKARRDFCRNQLVSRGVALRRNLNLRPPKRGSAVIYKLQPGQKYSFTATVVAEINGSLEQSPPSPVSKPITLPLPNDDSQWSVGGVLSKMLPPTQPVEGTVLGHHGRPASQPNGTKRGGQRGVRDAQSLDALHQMYTGPLGRPRRQSLPPHTPKSPLKYPIPGHQAPGLGSGLVTPPQAWYEDTTIRGRETTAFDSNGSQPPPHPPMVARDSSEYDSRGVSSRQLSSPEDRPRIIAERKEKDCTVS
ncbi:unnamed protein product [Chrysoparadoxa australica]